MRSTPCNSGDNQAIAWSEAGQRLDREEGAGEQEQRHDAEAEDRVEPFGVRCVAENAAIGAANAMPVRTAAGMPRTTNGEWAAPNSDDHGREDRGDQGQPERRSRRGCRGRCRAAESGVAYMAWNDPLQFRPAMIGNVASNDADCMAVAASSPGARNARYVSPPSAALADRRRSDPRPTPIAVRKSDRAEERAEYRSSGTSADTAGPMLEDPPGSSPRTGQRGHGLLDQGAAGEPQEDVLERRAPDEHGLRLEAALWTATAAASPSSA